jgi:integrase
VLVPYSESANAFQAGLEDLHFHDLRHEALSRFFELGLTTPEVASISDHRDRRMLFRYSHPMRQRMLQVIDRQGCSATAESATAVTPITGSQRLTK